MKKTLIIIVKCQDQTFLFKNAALIIKYEPQKDQESRKRSFPLNRIPILFLIFDNYISPLLEEILKWKCSTALENERLIIISQNIFSLLFKRRKV